jgi:hypothetical protein
MDPAAGLERRMEAFEMKAYRWFLKISWSALEWRR